MLRFQMLLPALLLLILMMIGSGASYALDPKNKDAATVRMHEVAKQIRQYKAWQILEARSKQRPSGYYYFRFKLLRNDGKVKIINIDPNNPNLRRLEQ